MREVLPKDVKSFIEFKLIHLSENERYLNEYRNEIIKINTSSFSERTSGKKQARKVEDMALKLATDEFILETQRTSRIINGIIDCLDATDKQLIKEVYLNKYSVSVEGAALKCNISKTSAYDRINKIFYLIALEMGYITFR